MIRAISQKDQDLYVLEETSKKDWRIKLYPNGFAELENKFIEYFGDRVGKAIHLPARDLGKDDSVIQYFIKKNIHPEKAEKNAVIQFCNNFIENVLLKTYSNGDSWNEFIKKNSGQEAIYRSISSRNMNERIKFTIRSMPELIEIPSGEWKIHEEFTYPNLFSSIFWDEQELFDYIEKDIEPSHLMSSGLVRMDMVFLDNNISYLVEIKTNKTPLFRTEDMRDLTHKRQRRAIMKKLILLGHSIHLNFSTDCMLVGIEYRQDKNKNRKMHYMHFVFDPENRELIKEKDSDWIPMN